MEDEKNLEEKKSWYPIGLREDTKISFDEYTARNLNRIKAFKGDMTGKVTPNDTVLYLMKIADELEVAEILKTNNSPQEEDNDSISDGEK